jgi:hypothetical protein
MDDLVEAEEKPAEVGEVLLDMDSQELTGNGFLGAK